MIMSHPKWRQVELSQRAERKGPTEAPELEYCLPGSRFARMMQLARMGASDRVMRRQIPGIDGLTIKVLRRLVEQESAGACVICLPPSEDEPGVLAG